VLRTRHLRFAARYAAHRFQTLHPFEVQAALLNACNLRCAYCCCPDLKTDLLDTAQWTDVIRGLAQLGAMRIKFQGGEPTLRKDFRALCAAAQASGILAAVVTNGLQFAAQPSCSSTSTRSSSASTRSRPPTPTACAAPACTRAPRGHRAGARAAHRLFINMVVAGQTLDEIEPMLDFCEARGIGLHAQPVVFGRKFRRCSASVRPQRRTGARHASPPGSVKRREALMFAAATYENVLSWADMAEIARRVPQPSTCMAGRFHVHIEPNGDVHLRAAWGGVHGRERRPRRAEAALAGAQHHDCGNCFSAYLTGARRCSISARSDTQMVRRG
jgi:MoaA/NifB/PqqE/SkfB family radical SAM enzyme